MHVHTAPPDGRDGGTWRPGLESAVLAVATACHGERSPVLMGIGAARRWGAIHFVQRDLTRIEASLEPTELGTALVTTPEHTSFDLLLRPHQGGLPDVARVRRDHVISHAQQEVTPTRWCPAACS